MMKEHKELEEIIDRAKRLENYFSVKGTIYIASQTPKLSKNCGGLWLAGKTAKQELLEREKQSSANPQVSAARKFLWLLDFHRDILIPI